MTGKLSWLWTLAFPRSDKNTTVVFASNGSPSTIVFSSLVSKRMAPDRTQRHAYGQVSVRGLRKEVDIYCLEATQFRRSELDEKDPRPAVV